MRSQEKIDERCQQYKSVFLMWNRAFSVAQKMSLSKDNRKMLCRFVDVAVDGHCNLGCTITLKVHLMWKRLEW